MSDQFADEHIARDYAAHSRSLRGVVRHELVAKQLALFLPGRAEILDVGGGQGEQAIRLARAGHSVTILDPSERMLATARSRVLAEPPSVGSRMSFVRGSGEQIDGLLGGAAFDVVICHGVVMYLEDPTTLIQALLHATRPGGITSILAKNQAAIAMRAGLEGRYADASRAFGADHGTGKLGVVTRGDTVASLFQAVTASGATPIAWFGVRVFTDHLGDVPIPDQLEAVIEAEFEAGNTDPYRQVASLIHVIARSTPRPSCSCPADD
ncbi:MAG: class I SAM-dependent methyltransferase [Chloroflexota bacterium]